MYKDFRYINAGTVEIYRYGHKAVEKVTRCLEPNENGFISIPADGGKYWTIGTSEGKFGEFAKFDNTFLSVNKAGYVWAKVGTEKAEKLVEFIKAIIEEMNRINASRFDDVEDAEEE